LKRKLNDVSTHGSPAWPAVIVAPGADSASVGATPLSVGESASIAGALAAGASHEGSW
jgi:hypothetical protein